MAAWVAAERINGEPEMPSVERHLIIVHSPPYQDRSDFEAVKEKMAARAPDIAVTIVPNFARNDPASLPDGPTVVFSPTPLAEFRPRRGKVFAGRRHTKMEEVMHLRAGKVRVPDTLMITPGIRLNPAAWGHFTVVKPNIGMKGSGIRLVRTKDVRWSPPLSPNNPFLAQRYVDTGTYPQSYRVMTVLRRPVYSRVAKSTKALPADLEAADKPISLEIASNVSAGGIVEMRVDLDVIAMATRAAMAFPDVPVLGVDLLRNRTTGHVYVIEVNSSRFVWHLSSMTGKKSQREFGVDYYSQLGALDVITDALVDITRREAR